MKTNAEIARELLKGARRRVSVSSGPICIAIDYAAANTRGPYRVMPVARALTTWIADMLDGSLFYTSWLFANHHDLYSNAVKRGDFIDCVRHGRLAWIDWMLKQDLDAVIRKYK